MTRQLRSRAILSLLVLALTSTASWAQVTIVVESDGAPVPEASVELWRGVTRAAARIADGAGRATFSASEVRAANTALVRRVGFAPGRFAIDGLVPEVRVALVRLAAPLPDVTVREARALCPVREQPAARALWEAARRRYLVPDTRDRMSWFIHSKGAVRGVDLGRIDRAGLYRGWRAARDRSGEDRKIQRAGYAWTMPPGHIDEGLGIWGYPSLEHLHAEHFAESVFGEWQVMALAPRADDADEQVIHFCARDRKRGGLDGTLRLGSDSSFIAARWQYVNPARDAEVAGGEVSFAPFDIRSSTPWLAAAEGMFWRRLRGGMYWHRWEAYEGWTLWFPDSARAVPRADENVPSPRTPRARRTRDLNITPPGGI